MKTITICVGLYLATTIQAADGLTLPDPLKTSDGTAVTSPEAWQAVRRPEILQSFRTNIYGRAPIGRPKDLRFEVTDVSNTSMTGRATRKLVSLHFSGQGGAGTIHLTLFIPNDVPKPAPGFLLICHRSVDNIDPDREMKSPFWPAERIIERGYCAAAFDVTDLDPDMNDGFKDGVHGIFDPQETPRGADAWGTIAAWAWGAIRVMDYLESDSDVAADRMAVVGHSRGGKAALWCGAEDERFAMVVSNDSGCTGAALARRRQGETVRAINDRFPHWFCDNYKQYNDHEDRLPVDQHLLIALMAPRLVYVASATEDQWADPEGEFLSGVHAEPVYRLFGLPGLGRSEMPEPEAPLHNGNIGYHLRTGRHNLTEYDWNCYMDFADKHLKTSLSNDP